MGKLFETDLELFEVIARETARQKSHIELIASENFVSLSVLEAAGSVLTNKYAEGYPKKRYYGGCEFNRIPAHKRTWALIAPFSILKTKSWDSPWIKADI